MGKHVDWITHKGQRILFVNVAGLNEAEYIAGLEEMKQELLRDRTAPLVLIDLYEHGVDVRYSRQGQRGGWCYQEGGRRVWAQSHCWHD